MQQIRLSNDRGFADHGWLKSRHTFSFADYHDPKFMGFRSLRVINEDRIAGGKGFGSHPHRDMEIISYVVEGALEHQDSMGTRATIRPGEVQRMSAGSGIVHSEYNAVADQESHFFQIWIQPQTRGGTPGYGQKSFAADLDSKKMVLVISQDAREGSIGIKQDVDMYILRMKVDETSHFALRTGRAAWVQVVSGTISVNGKMLASGDAAALEGEPTLEFTAETTGEFILFDLA